MRFAVIWSYSLVDPAVSLAALPRRCYQGNSSLHLRIVHAADPLFVAEKQNCMAPRIWKIQTFPLLKNTIADQFLLLRTKVPQILSSIEETLQVLPVDSAPPTGHSHLAMWRQTWCSTRLRPTLPLLRLIHCKWVVISRHNNDLKIEDTSREAEC